MAPHASFDVPPWDISISPNRTSLLTSNTDLARPPPSGTTLPHVLIALCLPLSLASPPFPHRGPLLSLTILSLVAWTLRSPRFTDDPDVGQPAALLWAFWISVLEKLFCGTRGAAGGTKDDGRGKKGEDPKTRTTLGPESVFWRRDQPAREAEGLAAWGPSKLAWATGLAVNLRGVGWSHEVKGVPALTARERHSRWAFVSSRALWVAYVLFMGDLVNHAWMQLYYVARREDGTYGAVGEVDSKFLTIRDPDWRWRLIKTLFWGPLPYYFINFQYYALSVVGVALGVSKPEDWPPFFGKISQVTTVRAFWGKFWQQLIRRAFNTFTGAAVDLLGISRGTTASSQLQIWLSFLLSGALHAYANAISVAPANVTIPERAHGMLAFFLWQALAISTEDAVQWAWRTLVVRRRRDGADPLPPAAKALLGWTWVVASFYISMPWAADVTLRMRIGDRPMLPVSVAGPLVRKAVGLARG